MLWLLMIVVSYYTLWQLTICCEIEGIIQGKKFIIFRNFQFLDDSSRAHQELSFKNNSRKKFFFSADLWSANVFSTLIILIDRWQVLTYLIRMPLLNQASHANQIGSTRIVLTVFPWILKLNATKEGKRACPFSSLTPRRKKTTKSFCKVWASKLAESD